MGIKKTAAALLVVTMLLGLAGCRLERSEIKTEAETETNSTINPTALERVIESFKEETSKPKPGRILMVREIDRADMRERGYYTDSLLQANSPRIVYISCGTKEASGYHIRLESIEDDGYGNVTIYVSESDPATVVEDNTVHHPTLYIQLSHGTRVAKVLGTDGRVYKQINPYNFNSQK